VITRGQQQRDDDGRGLDDIRDVRRTVLQITDSYVDVRCRRSDICSDRFDNCREAGVRAAVRNEYERRPG